jgi:uncharacterized membrane protein
MTALTHIQHPGVQARRQERPPKISDEYVGFNGRLAAWLTEKVGSMWSVYFAAAVMAVWMALATWGPLHRVDPFPFPFLLFLGNIIQLLLIFVILVGQQVLGRAADRRALQTYLDAESILQNVNQLHQHLEKQDGVLNQGIKLVESQPHPWIEERKAVKPKRVREHYVGINGRIAAILTRGVGTMWAFYVALFGQLGWMALATIGIIKFDPYPFAFLLFLGNVAQLLLMFVIMVGQGVLGQAGDTRAQQTYLDAEAVLHECARLQRHLTAQDKVIVKICQYIEEHAPEQHPVRTPEPPAVAAPQAG